jgi:hypothetical protein
MLDLLNRMDVSMKILEHRGFWPIDVPLPGVTMQTIYSQMSIYRMIILNLHKHSISGKLEVINGKIGNLQLNAYGYCPLGS